MAAPAILVPFEHHWTMKAFVQWAFGPRELAHTAALVRQAQLRLEELREGGVTAPGDRDLGRLTHEVTMLADQHGWYAEADLAAELNCAVRGFVLDTVMVRRLRGRLWALGQLLEARIAHNTLMLCTGMRTEDPAPAPAPVVRIEPWDV